MKTSAELIVFLAVVLGAIFCIETGVACASGTSAGQDQAAPTATAQDPELLELLKARKAALSKRLEHLQAQAKGGMKIPSDMQYWAIQQLKDAELDLARTDDERVTALEANLQRLQNLEKVAEAKEESGALPGDYSQAKANRIGGEIELHRAKQTAVARIAEPETKSVLESAEATTAADAELLVLLNARKEALREVVDYVAIQMQVGLVTRWEAGQAILRLNDVEMDFGVTEQQRIAIFEAKASLLREGEQEAQIKYGAGVGGKVDYLRAKANRLSGEIKLHKAKQDANTGIDGKGRNPIAGETKSVPQTAIDPELLEMLKARLEALSEVVDIEQRNLDSGNSIYEIVCRAILKLNEAKLELAMNADERMAVIEANLQVLKSLEVEAQGRRDAGTLSESDYLLTIANRLGGEIELRK